MFLLSGDVQGFPSHSYLAFQPSTWLVRSGTNIQKKQTIVNRQKGLCVYVCVCVCVCVGVGVCVGVLVC